MKTCSKCKLELNDDNFFNRGGKQTHLLDSWCKSCKKPSSRLRNQKYERTTRADLYKKNPLYYLWYIAKKRASKYNMEFSITPEDIIFTGYCPITKQKLDVTTNKMNSSISLDRVDNTKGYIKGNVVAVSRWGNLKKSNLSIEDLENILDYIKEYTK